MWFFILWIILSILAGYYATTKGRSFLAILFISLFLSPLVGFITAIIIPSFKNKLSETKVKDNTDKLIELSKMLEKGLITEEEFISLKSKLS